MVGLYVAFLFVLIGLQDKPSIRLTEPLPNPLGGRMGVKTCLALGLYRGSLTYETLNKSQVVLCPLTIDSAYS